MMGGFVPFGFRPLDDFARDFGVEKVGALLASGRLRAFRINSWGEMFAIEEQVWRGPKAREVIVHGKIGGRHAGVPRPDLGDLVIVQMPKETPKPSLAVSNIAVPATTKAGATGHASKRSGVRKAGRPPGSSPLNDAPLLLRMREIAEKTGITSKRKLATLAVDEGGTRGASFDSDVKRLAGKFGRE